MRQTSNLHSHWMVQKFSSVHFLVCFYGELPAFKMRRTCKWSQSLFGHMVNDKIWFPGNKSQKITSVSKDTCRKKLSTRAFSCPTGDTIEKCTLHIETWYNFITAAVLLDLYNPGTFLLNFILTPVNAPFSIILYGTQMWLHLTGVFVLNL